MSRRLRKLGLIALGIIAPLLVLEIAAWVVLPSHANKIGFERQTCVRRSALLGQEFRPLCTGQLAGTPLQINSLGLRGPEPRNDGTPRILALGDSCTWGWGVRQAETFPAALQRVLDDRGGQRYDVINAGAPGYTSHHGVLYLREHGQALRPAIVLIGFGYNDRTPIGDIETALARNRTYLPILELDDYLSVSSVFYHWARTTTPTTPPIDGPPQVTAERYRRNLETMIEQVRGRGATPVLITFLTEQQGEPYFDATRSAADSHDVPLVIYSGPRFDAIHPTAAGYNLFAIQLLERLRDAEYVR